MSECEIRYRVRVIEHWCMHELEGVLNSGCLIVPVSIVHSKNWAVED